MKPDSSRRLAALATGAAVLAGMAAPTAAAADTTDPAPRPTAAVTHVPAVTQPMAPAPRPSAVATHVHPVRTELLNPAPRPTAAFSHTPALTGPVLPTPRLTAVVTRPPASIDPSPRPTPRIAGPLTPFSTLGVDLRVKAKDCNRFALEGHIDYFGLGREGAYGWTFFGEFNPHEPITLGGTTVVEREYDTRTKEDGRYGRASLWAGTISGDTLQHRDEIGFTSWCARRTRDTDGPPGTPTPVLWYPKVVAAVKPPVATHTRGDEEYFDSENSGPCPAAARTFTGAITYSGPIPESGEATVTYRWVRHDFGADPVKSGPRTARFRRPGQTVAVHDPWIPRLKENGKAAGTGRMIDIDDGVTDTFEHPDPRTGSVVDRYMCTSE
ncbi:hypothetical protein PS9374_06932 [Planomonospora sphaerica]|uniref:Uncharacterized protein n=1 Tax=Planomonospora sphaerica TaxID=161355 RepID=A0A171DQA6_9ACTN|nr:hypothetical protein [Planomonospora sphaerica]GAT71241.1 hypothetical protein PS9374_06932 [Planomonospora sphaerica]